MTDVQHRTAETAADSWELDAIEERRTRAARRVAILAALVGATAATWSVGVGAAVSLGTLLGAVAVIVRNRPDLLRVILASSTLLPWLVIRHNAWLAMSIAGAVCAVVAVVVYAAGVDQRVGDLRWGVVWRRPRVMPPAPPIVTESSTAASVLRGAVFAMPIVAVFASLLVSADAVFAELLSPEGLPEGRAMLFVVFLLALVPILTFASVSFSVASNADGVRQRFGSIESTVVLVLVAALFALFVVVRLAASQSLPETDEALRATVRAGFFQLLAVAALTVVLLLWLQRTTSLTTPIERRRFLTLGSITVLLAAAIDLVALRTIHAYVGASFNSPLRYWSFGFGLMLLAVLSIVLARLVGIGGERRWVSAAFVVTWGVFLHAMAFSNPDVRIAEYNFANPQISERGEVVIAVNPIMWLSDDATGVIVDNLPMLEPMSNDRFDRTVDHLCTEEPAASWRDWNRSRSNGEAIRDRLCGRAGD